jgi:acylphosphatase
MTVTALYVRVRGRVQGVGFRQATAMRARQLGLHGWVRNCADGSVEAVATGAEEACAVFRTWIERGPPAARVDRVEVRLPDSTELALARDGFCTLPTR